MTKSAVFAAMPFFLASGAAFAEPATDEGAQHLTEVFQTYLGTIDGVVSVEVNGDTYDLTLDATPLIALAKDSGATGTMTPLEMSLTDNGDGTWDVSQDQALSINVSAPNMLELKEDFSRITLEGVFDESLMTFSSGKGSFTGIKVTETVKTPDAPETAVEMGVDSGTFDMTATANAAGGVDSTTTIAMTGVFETITMPPMGEGQPGMPVTFKAESVTETATGTGLKMDGIYKIAAWFVAHPDEAAMEADRAGIKTILTDALPIFGNVNGSGTVSKISVDTPMGAVGIDELGFTVDMNGVVADGKFREAFTLQGVTLPAGLVPDWAAPILPQKLSIDVQVTDFDAAATAAVGLKMLDQPAGGMTDDFALQAELMAALLPKGTVTIGLNPGGISGEGYALTYEGSMTAGPMTPMPEGKATVTLTGIDTLNAALANAPDDIKGQASMGIGMAQGLAKPGPNGELVWEIEATGGGVTVNGMAMQ